MTESINQLINICTVSAPGQKECDNALRQMQVGTLHYTTLHYTTLHYTTLHYTTLHYTTLHTQLRARRGVTTLSDRCRWAHYTTHYTLHVKIHTTQYTLHYTTLHYTTLHYTTLHYTTLHYTTLHTQLRARRSVTTLSDRCR